MHGVRLLVIGLVFMALIGGISVMCGSMIAKNTAGTMNGRNNQTQSLIEKVK